jgi:Arp2/3 complex, 34 kD subunit p34-Arc
MLYTTTLETGHPILYHTFKSILDCGKLHASIGNEAQNVVLDTRFTEDGSLDYHLELTAATPVESASQEPSDSSSLKLTLRISWLCLDALIKEDVEGLKRHLESVYLDKEGFSVQFEDLNKLVIHFHGLITKQDKATAIFKLCRLKYHLLSFPIAKAIQRVELERERQPEGDFISADRDPLFSPLSANSPAPSPSSDLVKLPLSMFYLPLSHSRHFILHGLPDRLCVYFSLVQYDILEKLFGQFMQDLRKAPRLQNCPQVNFNMNAPLNPTAPTLSQSHSQSYLVLTLFPRHLQPDLWPTFLQHLIQFYPYLAFHSAAAKSFLHAKMRLKSSQLLNLLFQ